MKPKTSVLIVSPEKSHAKSVFPLPGNASMGMSATISGEDDALRLVNTCHFDCVVLPDDGSAAGSGLARIIRIIRPDMPILQPGDALEPGSPVPGRRPQGAAQPGPDDALGEPAGVTMGATLGRKPGRYPRLVPRPKTAARS